MCVNNFPSSIKNIEVNSRISSEFRVSSTLITRLIVSVPFYLQCHAKLEVETFSLRMREDSHFHCV